MSPKQKNSPVLLVPKELGDDFCPIGYRANPFAQQYNDFTSDGLFQQAVYDQAILRARILGIARIIDLGCGAAQKSRKYSSRFEVIGVDLPQVVENLRSYTVVDTKTRRGFTAFEHDFNRDVLSFPGDRPTIIIAADVIEHLADPAYLLSSIRKSLWGGVRRTFISTPCREHNDGCRKEGPPFNPTHVREWSCDEFLKLMEHHGLRVLESSHVPERPDSPGKGTFLVEVIDDGT